MQNFMIVDAIKYAVDFMQTHFWALLKILLVFMAIAIAIGLVVTGSSLLLLSALSNNMWLTVALESPLLALVGFVVYGIWNVSFITYLLALERKGSASVEEHLKKSWSLRVLKVMAFDLVVVLFMATCAFMLSGLALGAWWINGMQLALWHRVALGVSGTVLLIGMVYLLMRLFFTKIVIVDTNTDIFTALSTSWSATERLFWRLFLLVIVIGILSSALSAIASQLSLLIVFLTRGIFGGLLGKIVEVFAALVNIVFVPLVTLYYYVHLKVVKSLVAGR